MLDYYTGMRWGEIVGLETEYFRLTSIRVEWQLYELDDGTFERCPPKDDSYRDIDLPGFVSALVSGHISRTAPQPCSCHGRTYVFRGLGGQDSQQKQKVRPVKLTDVARRAEVSVGTVSNVLNHPERVAEATRTKVEEAITDLGIARGGAASADPSSAAHWRRNGFATWVFQPAATGWYPKKAPQEARPVPLLPDPFPGMPVRGRNSQGRAEACWMPIAQGLTPHGLRHSHKTHMHEIRTHEALSHERLGHELEGIGGRYTHVTDVMRKTLLDDLTKAWLASLDARLAMHPRSSVKVLDDLLTARARKLGEAPKIISQNSPRTGEAPSS